MCHTYNCVATISPCRFCFQICCLIKWSYLVWQTNGIQCVKITDYWLTKVPRCISDNFFSKILMMASSMCAMTTALEHSQKSHIMPTHGTIISMKWMQNRPITAGITCMPVLIACLKTTRVKMKSARTITHFITFSRSSFSINWTVVFK